MNNITVNNNGNALEHIAAKTIPAEESASEKYHKRLPQWLKKSFSSVGYNNFVVNCLNKNKLHSVCYEARCPNRAECFASGTATFLILGNCCTRNCSFCAIGHGEPLPADPQEPQRVARAALELKLAHVVITSVTRDDLHDGGAGHFAATVKAIRHALPKATVEVLVPDFGGNPRAVDTVIESIPHILNHNIETVKRLYSLVRPQASYLRSLQLLKQAAMSNRPITVKSGLMVGLGETIDEVAQTMKDIVQSGCSILTIGQYLRPSPSQMPVAEYISPEQFEKYIEMGLKLGFSQVIAGPFIRSSYKAKAVADKVIKLIWHKTLC